MNAVLLIAWPCAMAGSCWLLRRAAAFAAALASAATLVELLIVMRSPVDDPLRVLGLSVVLGGSAQLVFGLVVAGTLVSLLVSCALPQGEHTPAIALLLLSCGAGIALLATPLLGTVLMLIAGSLAVWLILDLPSTSAALTAPATIGTALKFLLLVFLGVTLLFIGLMLQTAVPGQRLALALIVLGWALLLGLVPFHLALPELAAETTLPALGLVTGSLQLLALLLIVTTLDVQPELLSNPLSQQLVLALGSITVLGGGAWALLAPPRRALMFILTAHWGFIALGLASSQQLGVVGALALLIGHGLSVALLVVSLSLLERRVAGRTETASLLRERPLAATGLMMALLTLLGVPPLQGFTPLALVIGALRRHPQVLAVGGIGLLLLALAVAQLIQNFLLRPQVATADPASYDEVQLLPTVVPDYAPLSLRLLLLVLIGLGVVGGLFPHLFLEPITTITQGLPFVGAG
ncbi:MAG: hypothetical protein H0X37_06720 [Herpetosiphonaceae bacterium]|nr:hypothetical protein [Herpetosiphonaceae bacterium]